MRFGVLGPLAVWTDDGALVRVPDTKVRALLADLLLGEGRPVSISALIDDLWGDELPANPTSTLQTRVSQLRRALEEAEPGSRDLVVTQPPGYVLRVADDAVDVSRFRGLAQRARTVAEPRTRGSLLADALALWRGPAFADVSEAPFARAAIDRLAEERMVVIEEHAEARMELGEHHLLSAELAEVVAGHPLRQRLRAIYMRVLYRSGRHSQALETYHDLRTRLADELGLDPAADLVSLHQAILSQDPALAAVPAKASAQTNLPAAMTELIGRAAAVERVRARLRSGRLVTLTGPGGVGKTSLALEIARDLDDAWLVELAALDGSASEQELLQAIGNLTQPDGERVLVLDNCEHVVEQIAAVADRLLRTAPQLRILATSREPLGILGEQVWPVPPLDLPSSATDSGAVARSSAIQLFVARATAAKPDFQLTAANTAAVVEICRRLDGLPLALELAATRVRALEIHDLAARLDDRFRVLATGRRGAPDRQRTLQAMIEWSWDLLTEPEQAVLRRLAIHPEAWSLQAAEAICPGDVADLLTRLVDRSLVWPLTETTGSRYRLLETVRAFCLDRLRDSGELEETRRQYLAYYEELTGRNEPRLYGHGGLLIQASDLYREPHPATGAPDSGAQSGAKATATAADGTIIAVERWGQGPPLILVGGALNERTDFTALAVRLAPRFTVITYDRRGRGGSGDTEPYTVAREIEDLAAVIGQDGESAFALGVSSGAVLIAEAAARSVPITALVLIEPPFMLDDARAALPLDFSAQLDKLVRADRRGDAVELFLTTAVEMPAEVIAAMRSAPQWRSLEAMAHTLAYDMAVMGDFSLPMHWAATISVPTLVIDGTHSAAWRRDAAQTVTDLLAHGRRHSVDAPHDMAPDILAPLLEQFLL
ncbi:alpha/beta fold hydrolase [Sphaerisporangium perillae]|uniref:alpha/beta fold hydrolase n=1 Tax=Sphaerisporangium perillae TaxID=2935860 RepID=UPI00200E349F|nr:alpha/beta fold hydrolase [Sphaerisporangium perillae]